MEHNHTIKLYLPIEKQIGLPVMAVDHFITTVITSSSSRMRVIYHNWSAMKQRPHPQSVVSVSCHFLLQAPQCPCSVRKRFSRDHCCRGKSKPGCRIVGSHTR